MPRNDTPVLVPLTVSSLEELDISLDNTLSAKLIPSDRPGYIAVEITSKVTADVSFEDTDSTDDEDTADYESDTYGETRTRRKNFKQIVYIGADAVGTRLLLDTVRHLGSLSCIVVGDTDSYRYKSSDITVSSDGRVIGRFGVDHAAVKQIEPAPLGLDAFPVGETAPSNARLWEDIANRQKERFLDNLNTAFITGGPRFGKNALLDMFRIPTYMIGLDEAKPGTGDFSGILPNPNHMVRFTGDVVPLPNQITAPFPTRDELEQIRAADCHM